MDRLFTDDMVSDDLGLFRECCDEFEQTYHTHVCDVWWGGLDRDSLPPEMVADAGLLCRWDCWMFVSYACPDFADYEQWDRSGGYERLDMDDFAERLGDRLVDGTVRACPEYGRWVDLDDLADKWDM